MTIHSCPGHTKTQTNTHTRHTHSHIHRYCYTHIHHTHTHTHTNTHTATYAQVHVHTYTHTQCQVANIIGPLKLRYDLIRVLERASQSLQPATVVHLLSRRPLAGERSHHPFHELSLGHGTQQHHN